MRRLIATSAIAVIGVGGVLAGCGGGDAPPPATAESTATATAGTTAASPQDPAGAVSSGFATLRGAPYVSTGVTSQEVDTSQLPESLATRLDDALDAQGTNVTTTTRFESPDRVAIEQDIAGRTQQIVFYDGSIYVSADGSTWAELTGAAASAFSQASSLARINPADLFTGLVPAGSADVDGRPSTQYSGDVDVDKATELVASVIGGLGDLGSALEDVVSITGGTATIAVDDANGAVSRLAVTLTISLDFGAIAAAAGQDAGDIGSVGITSTATETVTSYGGNVTVQQPDASTTISTVAALGEFLTKG